MTNVKMTPGKKPNTENGSKAKKPSYEDLLKEVENLKGKLSNKPQSLEEQIKYYQEKQALVMKHAKLDFVRCEILDNAQKLKEEEREDELVSRNYAIRLSKESSYGGREDSILMKIQNPILIESFMDKLLEVVEQKKAEYEAEIQAY